ncbi:MAG TPA: hypothetical protein PKU78_04755 [Candidatus Dojkabacteria bacterium]|nr:hypothetical protein [Candidatus Dojkabacteria bacterium]
MALIIMMFLSISLLSNLIANIPLKKELKKPKNKIAIPSPVGLFIYSMDFKNKPAEIIGILAKKTYSTSFFLSTLKNKPSVNIVPDLDIPRIKLKPCPTPTKVADKWVI